jgi:hypothetical protein
LSRAEKEKASTDEELTELMQVKPMTGAEIVDAGLTGGGHV